MKARTTYFGGKNNRSLASKNMIQGIMIAVVMGVHNVPDRLGPADGVERHHKGVAMLDEPVDENGSFRGHKDALITLSARADLTIGIFPDLYEASPFWIDRHIPFLSE
jgi:hypothetical protein